LYLLWAARENLKRNLREELDLFMRQHSNTSCSLEKKSDEYLHEFLPLSNLRVSKKLLLGMGTVADGLMFDLGLHKM